MTEDPADEEGLNYAEAGVDIDASEAATAALIGAAGEFEGDYAGLVDIGDQYLALATDGVGTKLLVAEAIADYSTIGIDCLAMNVNDLVVKWTFQTGVLDSHEGTPLVIGDTMYLVTPKPNVLYAPLS